MKKLAKIILLEFLLFNLLFFQVQAVEINSKSAIIINAQNGHVLFEKNSNDVRAIASLTKLMTFYAYIDGMGYENLLHDNYKYNIDNSKYSVDMPILPVNKGEVVKIEDLFKSMLVFSANNAPEALADRFKQKTNLNLVDEMNLKAKDIGLNNTHYFNTNGLTEGERYNTSTVKDQAKLAYEILKKYRFILDYTSIKQFKYNGKTFDSTNWLLGKVDGLDGLKTGYTKEAGYCFIGTVDLSKTIGKGMPLRIITVVLGSDTKGNRFKDTLNLINYIKNNYENQIINNDNEYIIYNNNYKGNKIVGKIKEKDYILKNKNEKIEIKFIPSDNLTNNIEKNDVVGKILIKSSVDQKELEVLAIDNYKKKNLFERLIEKIKQIISGLGW